jgi:hypothetical protein
MMQALCCANMLSSVRCCANCIADLAALYAHRVFDVIQFEKVLAQARVADMTQRAIGWFKR